MSEYILNEGQDGIITSQQSALKQAVVTLELCREYFKHDTIFLEDYIKTVTHPGVSRLVGDNHDADTMAALTISNIKEVLG